MKTTIPGMLIAIFFMVLFTYAATSKLAEFGTFQNQLTQSPFITRFSTEIAYGLPVLELLLGVVLLWGMINSRMLLYGLYASLFLMAMFTSYIYMMLHFSPDIPCSCGGILSNMTWSQHFVFNIASTILAILGIIWTPAIWKEKIA